MLFNDLRFSVSGSEGFETNNEEGHYSWFTNRCYKHIDDPNSVTISCRIILAGTILTIGGGALLAFREAPKLFVSFYVGGGGIKHADMLMQAIVKEVKVLVNVSL